MKQPKQLNHQVQNSSFDVGNTGLEHWIGKLVYLKSKNKDQSTIQTHKGTVTRAGRWDSKNKKIVYFDKPETFTVGNIQSLYNSVALRIYNKNDSFGKSVSVDDIVPVLGIV